MLNQGRSLLRRQRRTADRQVLFQNVERNHFRKCRGNILIFQYPFKFRLGQADTFRFVFGQFLAVASGHRFHGNDSHVVFFRQIDHLFDPGFLQVVFVHAVFLDQGA